MELNEWLLSSVYDLGWVNGHEAGFLWTSDLSLGGNDLLLLVGLGLDLVVGLNSLDESLSGVRHSHVLDSDVQELVDLSLSDPSQQVDSHGPLVDREDAA